MSRRPPSSGAGARRAGQSGFLLGLPRRPLEADMGRISVVAWRLRGARRFEEASHGDCRELQRRSLARLRMAPPPASDGVRVRAAPYTSLRRNAVTPPDQSG